MAIYDSYRAQMKLFREYLMSVLPQKIVDSLEMHSGPDGSASLSVPDIMDFILSPSYSEPTSDELDNISNLIGADWKREIALKTNLDNMIYHNNTLASLCPDMKLSETALFKLAFNQAKQDKFALQNILGDWLKLHKYTDSLFTEFAEFLVYQNRNVLHSPLTNHQAFACEARYRPTPPRTHPLGAAAEGSMIPPAAPATGAAAKATPPKNPGNPDWTAANWKKFLKLSNLATRSQPAIAAPGTTNTVLGKICFRHGWNLSHDSPMCLTMRNNPEYTDSQRALTDYCLSRDSDEIDGKKIKTYVQRGCHPKM